MDLKKIYIEPTSNCNLKCKTCIRNTWTHDFKDMDFNMFKKIINDLRQFQSLETIMISGFGEPLIHKNIIDMIKMIKELNLNVELITNGTLLNEEMCKELINSKLDKLWVSIDGVSEKSYENIRVGAKQAKVLKNLINLKRLRKESNSKMMLGISFVAVEDNIEEIPELLTLARKIAAKDIKVTNVLPYTKDMVKKALYNRTITLGACDVLDFKFNIDLPIIDVDEKTKEPLYRVFRSMNNVCVMGDLIARKFDYCKFIKEGCMVIGADGRVSPCLALLYRNKTFLHGYERDIKAVSYGNVKETNLYDIWNSNEYSDFRKRVDEFVFPGCTYCGGCNLLESNEEDCFGNEFPVCGACLWAQGIIQCP